MGRELNQPGLFDSPGEDVRIDEVVRFALGDFASRGFDLAGRKLALDRLLGAFRRAFDEYGMAPLSDAGIAGALREAGAKVEELPAYVAKHPYRVIVTRELAESSLAFFVAGRDSGRE